MEPYDFSIYGERKNVNHFLKTYCKDYTIFKDQDTGEVRTKSPFDFVLSRNARLIYIEAKWSNAPMSDFQKAFMYDCIRTRSPWGLLRWKNNRMILNWHIGTESGTLEGLENILVFIEKLTEIE